MDLFTSHDRSPCLHVSFNSRKRGGLTKPLPSWWAIRKYPPPPSHQCCQSVPGQWRILRDQCPSWTVALLQKSSPNCHKLPNAEEEYKLHVTCCRYIGYTVKVGLFQPPQSVCACEDGIVVVFKLYRTVSNKRFPKYDHGTSSANNFKHRRLKFKCNRAFFVEIITRPHGRV